jgi:hypothetical protein
MRFSGYIFDVEGTLVDCVREDLLSLQESLADFGLTVPYDVLQLYSGLDGDQTLQLVAPDLDALCPPILSRRLPQGVNRNLVVGADLTAVSSIRFSNVGQPPPFPPEQDSRSRQRDVCRGEIRRVHNGRTDFG